MLASTEVLVARHARDWLVAGVLSPHVDGFAQRLVDRGYDRAVVRFYLNSVAHFAHWCAQRRISLSEIDEQRVNRFLERHLRGCECAVRCMRRRHIVRSALNHLLNHLRSGGHIPPRHCSIPPLIVQELHDFDDHLCRVRGLSGMTRHAYLRFLPPFLNSFFRKKSIRIGTLSAASVTQFAQRHAAGWKPYSIKLFNTALRSYFAFKAMQGEPTTHLAAALPRAAIWRLAQLPKMLTRQEIDRLLGAYDRTRATGKRDYAIARCLIDLGLRRVEVARLTLDDVDWRAGVLRIAAKGRRVDVLPLPSQTGRAIADYLRRGRPPTTRRELFVPHRPPRNRPTDPDLVRNAVRCAARHCGLQDRIGGTHILRHTVAGRLVQAGAPLKQIADLLRHRDLDTTTIYAKVDLPALRRVAMPWPGRSP